MYRHCPENQPIQQVTIFNQADSGGDSILTDDLEAKNPPSMFRIFVSLTTAGKFSAQITQDAVTKDLVFNSDSDLVANGLYIFDILVTSDYTINFEQDQQGQVINLLVVQELSVGAQ